MSEEEIKTIDNYKENMSEEENKTIDNFKENMSEEENNTIDNCNEKTMENLKNSNNSIIVLNPKTSVDEGRNRASKHTRHVMFFTRSQARDGCGKKKRVSKKPLFDKKCEMKITEQKDKIWKWLNSNSDDLGFANADDQDPKGAHELWGDPFLGNHPVKITCSNCRQCVNSKLYFKASRKTLLAIAFSAICGFCWVPVRYKWFYGGKHMCPLCNVYLGNIRPRLL